MKVSIALATYNGAKYLKQQLDSIQAQTCPPDELVVCDDCSKDSTVEILEEFKETASFIVIIIQNESNLGYTGNFEKAISLCTGDLIFICDQDDVWFRNKIETMTAYMQDHQEVSIAINDVEIVGKQLYPTGITKIQQINNLYGSSDKFIPGCCSVFRSSWKSIFLPFPTKYEAYDGWLHYVGKVFDRRAVIPIPLQYYRIHGENTSNFAPNSTHKLRISDKVKHIYDRIFKNQKRLKLESIQSQIKMQRLLLNRVKVVNRNPEKCPFNSEVSLLVENIEWRTSILQLRSNNIQRRNPMLTVKLTLILIFKGQKSGLTWKSLISDLLTK